MRKSSARVAVAITASILLLAACVSKGSGEDSNTLTVMTNANILSGLTSASLKDKSTISSWYAIYHKLWEKQFPKMKIKEIKIGAANGSDTDTIEVTKTLLGVNAGNPTDLIGIHGQLPELVKRGAVENLDKYYKAAGIKPSYFLKPLSDYVRYNGHWYGMPGASNPTTGTILYIPDKVRAAGIDPQHLPDTFSELWDATKKVTRFGPNGQIERIGLPVDTSLNFINFYCGRQTTYDPKSDTFHADAPCVKDYLTYNKRLLDFYGGVQ
jgi:ABC-type glycerol-3-phosphate transport system substrate-binding protein